MKRNDDDPDLLPPGVDPDKLKIGIRRVRGRNEASMRTVISVREHQLVTDEPNDGNTGPTPLETTLAALVGCKGVIINRCATAMRFKYRALDIEADGEVDGRGSRGVRGVRPYFNWVKLKVRLISDETPERLERLRKNVEYRCPVMNLFREADVDVEADWQMIPE